MLQALRTLLTNTHALNFDTAWLCEIGQRDNLEDRAGFLMPTPASGCWIVADGVGGHHSGEVAAQLAVDTLLQEFKQRPECSAEQVQSALHAAHQAIVAERAALAVPSDMATTAVMLMIDQQHAIWGHVGDSRLYWLRNGKIQQRTEDQSLVNMLLARGALKPEQVANFPERYVILQALGHEALPEVCCSQVQKLRAGDRFLLCTDGVWELLTEQDICSSCIKSTTAAQWLQLLQQMLVAKIASLDSTVAADNYTALVLCVNQA